MGDFTKNGTKIGTCGSAYYATLEMLEKHVLRVGNIDDAHWYIDPKQGCNFAFPFPEYDGKLIGDISNFHDDQRTNFFFQIRVELSDVTHHKDICTSLNPEGGSAVNVFHPCPCSDTAKTSTNFERHIQTFRLECQVYYEGSLCISGRCIYCGCSNIFTFDEALKIVEGLIARAEVLIKRPLRELSTGKILEGDIPEANQTEAKYLHEIIKRVLATYDYIPVDY